MRSARLSVALLTATMLAGTLGHGALGAPVDAPATPLRVADQAASTPASTTAFEPTDCPVAVIPPEGASAVCGQVTVPQRHADPSSGRPLALGVVQVPVTGGDGEAAPVVVLAGGADGSSLDLASSAGDWAAAFPGRDLVFMDHRGGAYSTPFLQCGEDEPARVDEALGRISGDPLDAHLTAWATCATRLRDAGFDLAAFDPIEAAADIADVVTALGYTEGYDLVAIGDGTRAAVAASRAGSPGLRTVTLDAPVDPTVSATAVLARDMWATVDQLSESCREDAACSETIEDLGGGIVDGAAQLALEPGFVTVDDAGTPVEATVDGDALVRAVAAAFRRHAGDIGEVVRLVAAATSRGDHVPVATALLAEARDTGRADVLAWTLRCAQDLAGATDYQLEGVPDAYWPLSGRHGDRDAVVEACAVFGVDDVGGTIHDPVTSEVPVLTLTGEFDPWSTTGAADRVRSGLTTSYGLVLPAIGHGTLAASPCALRIAGDFVADPTIEPDASCIAEMAEFTTGEVDPGASEGPQASVVPPPSEGPTPDPSETPKPARIPKARPVEVGLVKVADGFENANGIVDAGDDRLFVVEQEGYVVLLKRRGDGTFRRAGIFLDIRGRVICCGEKGMLGLAFPPDYAETGYFYVTFAGSGHTWNLEERRVARDDPDRADPDYKRRIIRVYKPRDYHWAGDIHFGPDGLLYVTVGDGGFGGDIDDPGDPENRAQDLGVIFGKMLRISPRRGREDGARYGIPDSNPFVGERGAKPEIWAYGLRNPWRWSFDRVTGDLWIGDVGMWRWEEVDRARAPRAGRGLNFGWRRMEGPVCYNPPRGCRTDELTMPFASLRHQNGVCAVTGGYVYRGKRYPRLRSWYVFADYCSGRIYLLDSAGRRGQRPKLALDTEYQFSALGEDADGELYIADYGPGNTIYRITGRRP
jgi:glucose/arabinose dehydrogenase